MRDFFLRQQYKFVGPYAYVQRTDAVVYLVLYPCVHVLVQMPFCSCFARILVAQSRRIKKRLDQSQDYRDLFLPLSAKYGIFGQEYSNIIADESVKVDDIIEAVNHFRCIDLTIDKAEEKLTERYIKDLHRILKTGTSDS